MSTRKYPAAYAGEPTRESDYSCQLLASYLGLYFDTNSQKFVGTEFLERDYLVSIQKAVDRGLLLIQVGPLSNVASVIEFLLSKDHKDLISKIELHQYTDQETLVFLPVTPEMSNDLASFMAYSLQINSNKSYFMSSLLSSTKSPDFTRLNDVHSIFLSNGIEFFYSETMSTEEMKLAFYHNRYSYRYPNLYALYGECASFLLRECTYFQYYIQFHDGVLYIGECSQKESRDIKDKFDSILKDLYSQDIEFFKMGTFEECYPICHVNDVKGFCADHEWYVTKMKGADLDLNYTTSIQENSDNLWSRVVSFHDETRKEALRLYEFLNYDVTSPPENFSKPIEVFAVEGENDTEYKLLSSQGVNVNVAAREGKYDAEFRAELEKRINDGELLRLLTRNVYRSEQYLLAEPTKRV